MSSDAHFGGDDSSDSLAEIPSECYDVLRHPRRLRVLEVLGGYDRAVSLAELATEVRRRNASAGQDRPTEREIRTSLVHAHLPKLADYGVIEWDGETASIGSNAPIPPMNVASLLEACSSADERALETIVHPVRMPLLRTLQERGRPCSIAVLASQLTTLRASPISDTETAAIALHHSHLPALADVGAIEYEDGWVRTTTESIPTMH
ncbi:hypothetical protein EL22_01610 [Halostagnicola sp. A56]|uniref:DUF7344 domain-containing protein n=1 Tax=Halostagnicola sp. A56 TaxID=1495067 RepID=UPI0004A0E2F1|nr:hypothetical protein [Halostagnicola sp. A56]KDE58888.1 hypothetical protein EL22_01610 [Halostagnicola sp. A56]